jgi:hypothetical protein
MQAEEKTYRIIPASSGVFIFLWALVIFMVAVFSITFANSGFEATSLAISVLVILIVGGVIGFFGYQSRHAYFSLNSHDLRIGPGIYGRTILKSDIIIEEVRVIDLNYDRNYQPKWRMNGAGLPGYLSGWFKLQNGEKALMFVTNRSSVVYIPTNKNYSVLLSVQQADEMVRQIRKRG